MDNSVKILLNSHKNINSVDIDNYEKVELLNKSSNIIEYDIKNVLSATEIFDAEREANPIYRIYGGFEYLSLLNGLSLNYQYFEDFFIPLSGNCKTIENSFRFYLLKPATGYTKITTKSTQYIRYYEVIAVPSQFELYPAGFSKNIYGEQTYAFNFLTDIDVSNYFDAFGFPITELFLYAQYVPTIGKDESLQIKSFNSIYGDSAVTTRSTLNNDILNIGDLIYGDLIEYSKSDYYQTQLIEQTYYIITKVKIKTNLSITKTIVWKYNPFIPFKLRYLSDNLSKANSSNTSYEIASNIPIYATNLDNNGNFVWREILEQGYIDPLSGIGVNYPFVNKRRYLFSNIILDVAPDLESGDTYEMFNTINFTINSESIKITPLSDPNNIGSPCQ
jgi:hypothetical protein